MKTEERCSSKKVERINNTEISFTMTIFPICHRRHGNQTIRLRFRFVFNFLLMNEMTISMFCFISDERNLVFMSDKSFFPNYYLFFFHQGELGVHIPCKPTHPNVTVSLIQIEKLNKEPNFEVFK